MTENPFQHPLTIRAHAAIVAYRTRTGDRTIGLSCKMGKFRIERVVTGPRGRLTTTSQTDFLPMDEIEALLSERMP